MHYCAKFPCSGTSAGCADPNCPAAALIEGGPILPLTSPPGCICPPGSNLSCANQVCPRKPFAVIVSAATAAPPLPRQAQILEWAAATFGPIALDGEERLARLFEEVVELAHARFEEPERAELLHRIIDRVYSRPRGAVWHELGQVAVTLEAFAEAHELSVDAEAQREFDRVRTIPQEQWRQRHAAKVAQGIAK